MIPVRPEAVGIVDPYGVGAAEGGRDDDEPFGAGLDPSAPQRPPDDRPVVDDQPPPF